MCGSMYFMGGKPLGPSALRRWREVGEDHLHLLRAGAGLVDEDFDRLAQLLEALVLTEQFAAAGGALDAIEVGGKREAAPAHFAKIPINGVFCRAHWSIVAIASAGCGGASPFAGRSRGPAPIHPCGISALITSCCSRRGAL